MSLRRSSIWIRIDVSAGTRSTADPRLDNVFNTVSSALVGQSLGVVALEDDGRRYNYRPDDDELEADDNFWGDDKA